jgi:hypothetical protein
MNQLPARFVLLAIAMAASWYAVISAFTSWDRSADIALGIAALTFAGWLVLDVFEARR